MPESGMFRSFFGRSRTFQHKHKDLAVPTPKPKHRKKKEEELPEEGGGGGGGGGGGEEDDDDGEFADAVDPKSPFAKHQLQLPAWNDTPDPVTNNSSFSSARIRRSSTAGTGAFHRHTLSTPSGARVLTPRWGKRLVIYTTSLRTVRRTYEDCRTVKVILRGLRVAVDERDLAMDASYRREMLVLHGGRQLPLPRAFVGRKCLGGVEEIRSLHEDGELEKLLDREGVAREEPGWFCHVCGGLKFLTCNVCDGSRKVFDEEEDQLKRCLVCNENGLIRCPNCS